MYNLLAGTLSFCSGKVRMSNGNTSSFKERRAAEKEIPEGIVVQCSNSQEGRQIYTSKVIDVPVIEVECVVRGEESCSIRFILYPYACANWCKTFQFLVYNNYFCEPCTEMLMKRKVDPAWNWNLHQRSAVSDSNCPALIPVKKVWAKTASKMCWPAEVFTVMC